MTDEECRASIDECVEAMICAAQNFDKDVARAAVRRLVDVMKATLWSRRSAKITCGSVFRLLVRTGRVTARTP